MIILGSWPLSDSDVLVKTGMVRRGSQVKTYGKTSISQRKASANSLRQSWPFQVKENQNSYNINNDGGKRLGLRSKSLGLAHVQVIMKSLSFILLELESH